MFVTQQHGLQCSICCWRCCYRHKSKVKYRPLLLRCCIPATLTHLQDIYKYVTHEKGLLGSQGDYNARHRRLCAPPFRNKQQLQRFADVVVQRCAW